MKRKKNKKQREINVAIVTDGNDLVLELIRKFLSKFINIDIFSDDSKLLKIIRDEKDLGKVSSYKITKRLKVNRYDYQINLNLLQGARGLGFLERKKAIRRIKLSLDLVKNDNSKLIFVFPFVQKGTSKKKLINEIVGDEDIGKHQVIFIGEIVGKQMNMNKNEPFAQILKHFIKGRVIELPKVKYLYLLKLETAVNSLIKSLFSFRVKKGKEVVVSKKITPNEVFELLRRKNKKIIYTQSNQSWYQFSGKRIKKRVIKMNINKAISEIIKFHLNKKEKSAKKGPGRLKKQKEGRTSMIEKNHEDQFRAKRISRLKIFYILLVLTISSPLIIIFFEASLLKAGEVFYKRNSLFVAKQFFLLDKSLLGPTSNVAGSVSKILDPGGFVGETSELTDIASKATNIYLKVIRVRELAGEVYSNSIKGEAYLTDQLTGDISLELNNIYIQTAFLIGEIENKSVIGQRITRALIDLSYLRDIKEKSLKSVNISSQLPYILGKGEVKTYLIMLQNDTELRPTGGKIETFALLTFNEGALKEIQFNIPIESDKLLGGHVEPPMPLKKYFGENQWTLGDSNWNPDFVYSAKQAEWFIDKELDRQLDGVVAVNSSFINKLLIEHGKIEIEELGIVFNKTNVNGYFKLKTEEERAKQELMKKIFVRLFEELADIKTRDIPGFFNLINNGLKEKQIQIFLHNNIAQKAISNLGYGGEIIPFECINNCQADDIRIIEASFGDCYISDEISREANLEIVFEEGVIKYELKLRLRNESPLDSYDAYVRVFTESDAGFSPVIVSKDAVANERSPDLVTEKGSKEAGVQVSIEPRESASIQFTWERPLDLSFKDNGRYLLSLRKQPGIESYDVDIKVNLPDEADLISTDKSSLTKGNTFFYNTSLWRDFVSQIYW